MNMVASAVFHVEEGPRKPANGSGSRHMVFLVVDRKQYIKGTVNENIRSPTVSPVNPAAGLGGRTQIYAHNVGPEDIQMHRFGSVFGFALSCWRLPGISLCIRMNSGPPQGVFVVVHAVRTNLARMRMVSLKGRT